MLISNCQYDNLSFARWSLNETSAEVKGKLEGLTVGLFGDLKFGRIVHSLIAALSRYTGVSFATRERILSDKRKRATRIGWFFYWRRGRDSFSPAGSVRDSSDCHRQSFTPVPFESPQMQ